MEVPGNGRQDRLAQAFGGLPVVALVGRANVGKSTLFNRIAGGQRAITSPIPGTTRDLNFARAGHGGCEFVVADSGGLELGGREPLLEPIVAQALRVVALADVVIFLLDGRAGLSDADSEAFQLIRETGKPLVAAVNKIDTSGQETAASEFYVLGAEELFFISGAHGRRVDELLGRVVGLLPAREARPAPRPHLRLALIGRPNVGKSSLLNRLVGYQRTLVDEAPGTTRDTVDVPLRVDSRDLVLVDTAGIRRPSKVAGQLEPYSVKRAIEAIRRAEVLLLVIDACEGITDQDARLARLVGSNDRGLVTVCNKWDLAAARGATVRAFIRDARRRFPFLQYAPMVFASALTGDGVKEILPAALKVGDSFHATFQTAHLNRVLAQATEIMDLPLVGKRKLNLMYVTQVKTSPPRLLFFSNVERGIPAHYVRFLEGRFRAALALEGSPLRLEFRRTGRTRASLGPRHSEGGAAVPGLRQRS